MIYGQEKVHGWLLNSSDWATFSPTTQWASFYSSVIICGDFSAFYFADLSIRNDRCWLQPTQDKP